MPEDLQTPGAQGSTPEAEGVASAEAAPVEANPAPEAPADWLAGVPEEFREDLKGYDSPESALEGIREAKAFIGDIPREVDGYKVTFPEDVDDNLKSSFLQHCHANKIPTKAAQAIVDYQSGLNAAAAENHKAQVASWVDDVKKLDDFGAGTDEAKFNESVSLAKSAVDQFATDEAKEFMHKSGFGNHPALVQTFYNIAKAAGLEPTLKEGNPSDSNDLVTRLYGSKTGE